METTTAQAPHNRAIILNRAADLFARSGYDAIGVQEIVAAAGVTKPTLYHYFGSKRGVLEALFAERFQPFLDELDRAARFDLSLSGCLGRVVAAHFDVARSQPALYRIQLSCWFGSPENEAVQLVQRYVARQVDALVGLFSAAAAGNGNMRGREAIYAATLVGAINGRIVLAERDGSPLDDHAVWQTVQYFSHGIYS